MSRIADWAIWLAVACAVASLIVHDIRKQKPMAAALEPPAVVVWGVHILTPILKSGQPFRISYEYSKRAECYPPKGEGDTQFRLWSGDGATFTQYRSIQEVSNRAPPTERGFRDGEIALPPLSPGHYALQFHSAFQCQGTTVVQYVEGQLMEFDVVR